MMKHNKYNISIMGCGLCGMIMAEALSKIDSVNNVTIFEMQDTNSAKFLQDIRSTALTANSYSFLNRINVIDKLNHALTPISDIYVVDNKSPNMIHFDPASLLYSENMGYMVRNMDFKKALFDIIKDNKKITLIDNFTYQDIQNNLNDCVIIDDNKNKYQFDLLILCEGFNSPAKSKFFTPKFTKSYKQYALTFIVKHEKSHEGTAVEHFMPSGPFAILPLSPNTESSVVWTVSRDYQKLLLQLPRKEFAYIVQQNFGPFLGKISIQSDVASYPLHAAITSNYYNNRIVLAGGSAHVIHPLAGQGLNQAIKDIGSLADIIANKGVTNHALEQYKHARERDNMNMFVLTDIINTIFSNHSKSLFHARKVAFTAIDKLSSIKKQIVKYASGM